MTGTGRGPAWSPCPGPARWAGSARCWWSRRRWGWVSAPGWRACPGPIPVRASRPGRRTPSSVTAIVSSRSGMWTRRTGPRSPGRCWGTGCGWCCGPTPPGSCCWRPCPFVTCVIPARTWICRSAPRPRACPASAIARPLPLRWALVRIDLHSHSTASDGTDPPAEVMRRARAAGLDVIALTDHDTLAGHDEARRALPPGLALVPGMELSGRLGGHSVHLLAYHVDPAHAGLAEQLAAITTDRLRRGRDMVDKLRELGVDITWEQVAAIAGDAVVGRPHIARAMVAAGAIDRPDQAFTADWIGPGGRAYVSRYALDPERTIRLVSAAGGVSVLAHPGSPQRGWVIGDDEVERLAGAGLGGLEVAHPDHDEAERRRLARLAAGLGLVSSGGSDDHGSLTGHRLGCETIAPGEYERLMSPTAGA